MSIPNPRSFFFAEWRERESSSAGEVMTGVERISLTVVSAATGSQLSFYRDRMENDNSRDSFMDRVYVLSEEEGSSLKRILQ